MKTAINPMAPEPAITAQAWRFNCVTDKLKRAFIYKGAYMYVCMSGQLHVHDFTYKYKLLHYNSKITGRKSICMSFLKGGLCTYTGEN